MLRLPKSQLLEEVAEVAAQQVGRFDAGNLAIAAWALSTLGTSANSLAMRRRGMSSHRLLDLALERASSPQLCSKLGSRALSMMVPWPWPIDSVAQVLACHRTARPGHLDQLLWATRAQGQGIGASGYSAAVMAAEQSEAAREVQVLEQMAQESADQRMQAGDFNGFQWI